MNHYLTGKTIAILVAQGFEQWEMTRPRKMLEDAGAQVHLISGEPGAVRGWRHSEWGDYFPADVPLEHAREHAYSGLVIPGGLMSPTHLRCLPAAVDFVRTFFQEGLPVAAMSHGPWLLIEAHIVGGRRVTSDPALKTDLENAGAHWQDTEVVSDQGLITSRRPEDIPAFNRKLIEEFAEGVHFETTAEVVWTLP